MSKRIVAILLLIACAALGRDGTAQVPELRVLASNGVKAAMEALLTQCESATGRHVAIRFNSSAALKESIEAGEAFDVVIGTTELVDALIRDGRMRADSRARVARSGIGIGVRAGAPRPDITTPDALKGTLLNARSITYAQDGASRVHIDTMLKQFGIADSVKPKTILEQGSIRSTARVVQGDAELVITLVSEILPISGIELLGPLPAALQHYVSLDAGIGTRARDPEAARRLTGFLVGSAAAVTFKAKGLEPR